MFPVLYFGYEFVDNLAVFQHAKHLSASAQFVQKCLELCHGLLGRQYLHAPLLLFLYCLFLHFGALLALAELLEQHLRAFLIEEWHFIELHQFLQLGVLRSILIGFQRAHQHFDLRVVVRVLLEEPLGEGGEVFQCGHFGVEVVVVEFIDGGGVSAGVEGGLLAGHERGLAFGGDPRGLGPGGELIFDDFAVGGLFLFGEDCRCGWAGAEGGEFLSQSLVFRPERGVLGAEDQHF